MVSNIELKKQTKKVTIKIPRLMVHLNALAMLLGGVAAFSARDIGVEPLIIQGEAAKVEEYPFMVQLRMSEDTQSHCGGSLIADRFVLTAAHCAKNIPIHYILVNMFYNTPNASTHTYEYRVKKVTLHDQYDAEKLVNDYAMIELYEPVKDVKPVMLPDRNGKDDTASTEVKAIGWGVTDAGDRSSASLVLKEDDFTLMDTAVCKDKMIRALRLKLGFDSQDTGSDQHMSSNSQALIESINSIHIDDSVHCINSLDGNSPCYGDSGGPLLVDPQTETPMVVGIASWLAECGVADYPTVYARVTSAQTFIDAHSSGHRWHGEEPIYNLNLESGSSTASTSIGGILAFILLLHQYY